MATKKKSTEPSAELPVHAADLQVSFWAFLQQIRNKHLSQALSSTVSHLEVTDIDRELAEYAEPGSLSLLASHGLRGEGFLPVPALLKARPELLGYYRLLYGISQKEFYNGSFARFRSMEMKNQIAEPNEPLLPQLCRSLCKTGAQLLLVFSRPPSMRFTSCSS
jgi:hypothetical protein